MCSWCVLLRENPITRNLELTLPDKRGVGNKISWKNARFFEYTGTNAFSRIQKEPIPQDGFRAKTKRFPDLPGSRGNGKKLDESLLVRIDYFFSSSEFATRLPVHRPPRAESEEHEVHGLVHSARGRHGIAAEVA